MMHFGQRTGSGHVTVSHTNTPSSQPSISLTHHHPHLYPHLQRGTAPPGRFPATQHLHHDLQRVKTWPQRDRAPNGGGGHARGGRGHRGSKRLGIQGVPTFFLISSIY